MKFTTQRTDMRTNEEYKNFEAERDALILAVADHVTVRSEQYAQIEQYKADIERLESQLGLATSSIDALAARVAVMLEALSGIEQLGKGDPMIYAHELANEALATPDDSAAILARRDAAIWLEAADIVDNADTPDCGGWTTQGISDALRARAAELGKAHG